MPTRPIAKLSHILGGNIATAYFRLQLPPELEFDTDRQLCAAARTEVGDASGDFRTRPGA
jgi:hypothetical protein